MKEFLRKFLSWRAYDVLRNISRPFRNFFAYIFLYKFNFLHFPLKKKRKLIRFEIHLAEHCNLNCKSCNNFSCIAKPELVDVEEFKRDFARMGEIFSHECEQIYLLGGEPLLHPEIITLMKTARENFTQGNIYVFTNGILLPSKSDDFWKACHDYNIGVLVSAYPIKIDVDTIRAKAEKFGVKFNWAWGQDEKDRDTFMIDPINLKGDGNSTVNFIFCPRANNCINLHHGRLYPCSFAPFVHHFSERFGKNIAITDADSIDIYGNETADSILQKLTEAIPACRYCNMKNSARRKFKWGITEKNINEWL